MPHAIIRGRNGCRHEVNFGDSPIRVEVHSSEETIELFIEADYETLPEGRRRFAIVSVQQSHRPSRSTWGKNPVTARVCGFMGRDIEVNVYPYSAQSALIMSKRLLL